MQSKLSLSQLAGMNCHYARHSFEFYLDSLVENGLTCLEVYGASPHLHVDDAPPHRVRQARRSIEARGLTPVCYTPETVVYPINIAAEEDDIRARSLAFLRRGIEITGELGCPTMLLTPGWGCLDRSRDEAMKRSLESIASLTRHAEECGIRLALEHLSPISSNLVNTAAQIRAVIDAIGSPNLKGMLDTCQVGLVHEHVQDYLDMLGDDLIHVHLVDGTPGGHLAFGDGTLPLEDFVQALGAYGYRHYLSMEIADRRYFFDPRAADRRSIEQFKKWIA